MKIIMPEIETKHNAMPLEMVSLCFIRLYRALIIKTKLLMVIRDHPSQKIDAHASS
jgi:hypothetical protein